MLEHVVVVTDGLSVDGGSSSVALRSAAALAQTGLRVTVFAAAGEPSAELTACTNVRIVSTGQGDALSAKNRLGGAVQGIWNARAFRMMDELLATLDPQKTVVHVHGWTKALSSSVVAAVARAKFPVVLTLHEYFTGCPIGCLYLHRENKVCTLAPMSVACITTNCDSRSYAFKLYRVLRQFVTRTAGRIPSGIAHYITVSDFSRRIVDPFLPRKKKLYAVDNPVEAVRESRVRAEKNDIVVFIGRLSAEKGGVLLAQAARIAGLKVVFIGDGPERDAIARANPDAQFTGWLDRANIASYLRAARVVAVPSLWYETLGLVVLEAAALGVPAIVHEGTAARDLVSPGRTGLAFERGSVAGLAEQLRACADSTLVEALSRAAYDDFWSAPPTMQLHVERLLATYEEILTGVAPALTIRPNVPDAAPVAEIAHAS